MSVLYLIIVLLAIGFAMWLVTLPRWIDPTAKLILHIALVIVMVLILLSAFGILPLLSGLRVPSVR